MPLPPYNGFGSEHDSLASYFNLIPKPRKYDATKQATLDAIIFRLVLVHYLAWKNHYFEATDWDHKKQYL